MDKENFMDKWTIYLVVLLTILLLTISYKRFNTNMSGVNKLIGYFLALDNQPSKTVEANQPPKKIISYDNNTSSSNLNFEDLSYPNSSKVAVYGNTVVLDSSDDAMVITNWYKNKLITQGFKNTSFITTNVNGNLDNSLIAQDANNQIKVEISKFNSSDQTKILLSIEDLNQKIV